MMLTKTRAAYHHQQQQQQDGCCPHSERCKIFIVQVVVLNQLLEVRGRERERIVLNNLRLLLPLLFFWVAKGYMTCSLEYYNHRIFDDNHKKGMVYFYEHSDGDDEEQSIQNYR